MTVNWKDILRRLQSYPKAVHTILPACSNDELASVEEELGTMPHAMAQMLRYFNGAKLFIADAGGGETLTIFGISTGSALPRLEWDPEWYIDKFTRRWRSAGNGRDLDWAIAMTNYGGLILLEQSGKVKEWDTGTGRLIPKACTFDEWIQETLRDGDAYLAE